ncbi:MAG: hypothetical protein GY803_04640 [Chloroflexi bacterium]|nr:hypothetical protein [Chloroflexota bacterium]
MPNKRLAQILLFFSVGLLILARSAHIQAETPASVGLLYFTATPQENSIRLDWKTETEFGAAGFIIQRSSGTSDDFETLDNIGFVASQGGVATGAAYSEVDDTAVYGQTYAYKLVEIETDTNLVDLETIHVTFIILQQFIYLPVIQSQFLD